MNTKRIQVQNGRSFIRSHMEEEEEEATEEEKESIGIEVVVVVLSIFSMYM
jgi:hypothetical protein